MNCPGARSQGNPERKMAEQEAVASADALPMPIAYVDGRLNPGVHLPGKPFSLEELAAKVRSRLDAAP